MRAAELQHTWRRLLSECNRSRFNLVNASMRRMQQHNYHSLYNINLYTPVLSTHIHSPFCLAPSLALFLFLFHTEKRTDWGFALPTCQPRSLDFFCVLFPPLCPRSLLIPHSWIAILKTWEKSTAPIQEKKTKNKTSEILVGEHNHWNDLALFDS